MAQQNQTAAQLEDTSRTEQEFQLLGILLQFPDQIDQAADEIQPRHISHPQARMIYENLLDQFQQSGSISRTKLLMKLREEDFVENPEALIDRLTSGFNTRDEMQPTIDLVKQQYQRQLLRKTAESLENLADRTDLTIDQYQSKAQELVFEATSETTDVEKHIFSMEEALINSYEAYIDRRNDRADVGVQSGFMSLDRVIGGFKKGHLCVIAASTSMGKTAFAINIAKNVMERDIPVGMISLEMAAPEIVDRLIIQEAEVNAWKYSQGHTNEQEDQRISRALNDMHEYPLMISDERGLNVAQIRARLRKFQARMDDLGLVIIDYLQMIQLPEDSPQNTARAIGDVVLQLRNLASELELPLILISQISRSYKSRSDQRPVLSDLRDSGNIEEIADSVIFLYREEQTSAAAREKAEMEGTVGETDIIVAKQRTGQTGSLKLQFDDDHIRFLDPENMSVEGAMPNEG